jgi:6-pyruvoyl-tetrahydropterin synthase
METYCVRKCIFIYHGISWDQQEVHGHTIEVASYIQKADRQCESFSQPFSESFSYAEERINTYLDGYTKQFLNELPEFHEDTSIENIGEVFFARLTEIMEEQGMILQRLEIGETPLRVYAIFRHEV